jgi:glycosyltransferase involved in cell wall biosynthesis
MRITFLAPNDLLTGGNRVLVHYASLMQGRGHDVLIVTQRDPSTTLREHLRALRQGRWREMNQEKCSRREPGYIALSGLPHRVLDCGRPIMATDVPDADVIVATWWETASWMQAMPVAKGRKVHLIQGYETWWGGEEARALVQATLRLPNVKIAISSGLKREIEADLGDLGIQVINNAVDDEQFDAPVRARGTPPTVGFVYAADLIKGPDRCLKIIERLKRKIPEVHVIAFGAQPPSPGLPLPAGTEFHLRPAQEEIPGLYARCDAWIFATRIDSFGLPILEAMACRTPVVGLPVGAAADLLGAGAGVLVAPACEESLPEAMAHALYNLLQGPVVDWQAMSAQAYARAHSYSWHDAVDRFESLLGTPEQLPTYQSNGETTWITTSAAPLPV